RNEEIINMQIFKSDQRLLLVSKKGRGFIVASNEVLAQTKLGKKIMNFAEGDEVYSCEAIERPYDHVAVLSSNRKLLIFRIDEIPELKKGQGVQLQKYKEGEKLASLKLFFIESGLTWSYLGQTRKETRLDPWISKRGKVGKIPPAGLARGNGSSSF
ncbi:MAG: DNA gyrase C-terminal beta-propeller domain-containing protein, partial [Pseudomonadota bacterium]